MKLEAMLAEVQDKAAAPSESMNVRLALAVCVLLALMLAAPLSVQAGCIARTTGEVYLNMPSSGYLFGSYTPYSDSSCTTVIETDSRYTFSDGIVQASSEAGALSLCEDHGPAKEYMVFPWTFDAPNIWFCGPVKQGSGDESSGTSESRRPIQVVVRKNSDGSITHAIFTNRENLPLSGLKLRAFDGLNSGIQFRRLDAWGIGVQEVLDMGFLDAVDVWSNVGRGFEACFPLVERIVFLDAATSPRSVVHVRHQIRDQYTCAAMDRAGTMVLVEAEQGDEPPADRSYTEDDVSTAIYLKDCMITPIVDLRLRGAPWGDILDIIPKGTTVVAKARTKSWVNVKYMDYDGWNAAWQTKTKGNCAWSNISERKFAWSTKQLIQ